MNYRFRVVDSEAAANGNVYLDTFVERSADGETREAVPNGHRTVVLDGPAVLAITGGPGTTTEKRAALLALFEAEVRSFGIDTSDNANTQLVALLPAGWPVTVTL